MTNRSVGFLNAIVFSPVEGEDESDPKPPAPPRIMTDIVAEGSLGVNAFMTAAGVMEGMK
eukprot:scaffold22432_cov168-Amphora_coffeaeformis.AAC.5